MFLKFFLHLKLIGQSKRQAGNGVTEIGNDMQQRAGGGITSLSTMPERFGMCEVLMGFNVDDKTLWYI